MKKRVLWIFPKSEDSTSWWRGSGPFKTLARTMPEVEFVQLHTDVNWDSHHGFDLIFLQRPSSPHHKAAMDLAKRMRKKVWLDYDDDLFSLPYSNPACLTYNNRDVQRDIVHMISTADVVTVSTEDLRKKYVQLNKNTFTVPNSWNDELHFERAAGKIARSKAVLWRGTRTHAEDLDNFLPQIKRIADDHKDWKFVFIGGAYWKIHHTIAEDQLNVIEPMEQTQFYETIYKLGAKIMMVPLADHSFNRAKSNIAWQEGSYCGSAVVCPAWEEWVKPGAFNYNDPDDFEVVMRDLMKPGKDLSSSADLSWTYIRENLTTERINSVRRDIMKQLLGLN